MPEVNAALVTLVREYRELNQTEVAERAGFSQAYVSKVESGVLQPTDESIARLADVLDWPIDFFYRTDRVYGFGTACMYHRKRASLSVHALRTVQAKINVVRMAMAPLIREIEISTPNHMPVMDVDAFDGPASIAQLVRGTWRMPLGPVDNLVQTLEAAGGIVYRVDFGTRLLDAVSHWPPDMPPMFFVNVNASGDRLRFSLAHELGHVVMHASPTRDMEDEADDFAAEFLMPAREIGPYLTDIDLAKAGQLKPYWKVAMSALIRRARDLGYINKNKASRLFMQMSSLGIKKVEPVQIPLEEPTVARQIMEIHRTKHGYSVDQLVDLAGIPEEEFRAVHVTDRPVLRAVK